MARMTKLHASDCHACEHYLNSCMKSVSARSNSRKTPGVRSLVTKHMQASAKFLLL